MAQFLQKLNKESGEKVLRTSVQQPMTRIDEATELTPQEMQLVPEGEHPNAVTVGNTAITITDRQILAPPPTRKRKGQCDKDGRQRAKRKCSLCGNFTCPGKTKKDLCTFSCKLCKRTDCSGINGWSHNALSKCKWSGRWRHGRFKHKFLDAPTSSKIRIGKCCYY